MKESNKTKKLEVDRLKEQSHCRKIKPPPLQQIRSLPNPPKKRTAILPRHPKSFSHARIRVATASMEYINKTICLECKGLSYYILVCEDHLADSDGMKTSTMEDSDFTEASNSEEVSNTPEAAARVKNDGDEVAQLSVLLGTDLVCTNETKQRKEPSCSLIGEELGTVVEETLCPGGSIRSEGASVEGTLMEGADQNSKNNDGRLKRVQQAPSGKPIDGCGPGIKLDVILANEPFGDLGPGIGPGINLEVNLGHVPNHPIQKKESDEHKVWVCPL
ncbi:unnamed protein product [Camellia sinensis]